MDQIFHALDFFFMNRFRGLFYFSPIMSIMLNLPGEIFAVYLEKAFPEELFYQVTLLTHNSGSA